MIRIQWDKKKPKDDILLENLKKAHLNGGLEAVKEVCRNTKGKVAAAIYIFTDEVIQGNKYEN